VLYLGFVDVAFVIEWCGDLGEDSLKFHPHTMFSLYLECGQAEKDHLIARLWERGSDGITESDLPGDRCGLRAFFADDAEAPELSREFAGWSAFCQAEEPRDWIAEARSRLAPMCVGARFFLVPEWRDDPTPPGRMRIAVNPGMAFGTGAHETTQLCLEALERELKPGMTVLDVGTGSGILARAAALLGAGSVIASDIDPVAVELARQPFSFVGTVDAVRGASVDLAVANISPEAIIALAPQLMRVLRAEGVAIVSGFEAPEVAAVSAALEASGARVRSSPAKGSWNALIADVLRSVAQ
jgi:ribosomal protein L11 methyltransferase